MSESFDLIELTQTDWIRPRKVDLKRPDYAAGIEDNLFLGSLRSDTRDEFRAADGSELNDSASRPAKMRAALSSSALVVNFFDPWRGGSLSGLGEALGTGPLRDLRFEYKPANYPVGSRSPNLDLLIFLSDGDLVAIESKFAEPYRNPGKDARLSSKYFSDQRKLWADAGLTRAQELAATLAPRWQYLDAAQLLKHLLGLANDTPNIRNLLYLWYDTGLPDAAEHRQEIERFGSAVNGDRVAFRALSYQTVFAALSARAEPKPGWRRYMERRYFSQEAV